MFKASAIFLHWLYVRILQPTNFQYLEADDGG